MNQISEDQQVVQLPCLHTFHNDCCVRWLTESRNACPLCGAEAVAGCNDKRDVREYADDDADCTMEHNVFDATSIERDRPSRWRERHIPRGRRLRMAQLHMTHIDEEVLSTLPRRHSSSSTGRRAPKVIVSL